MWKDMHFFIVFDERAPDEPLIRALIRAPESRVRLNEKESSSASSLARCSRIEASSAPTKGRGGCGSSGPQAAAKARMSAAAPRTRPHASSWSAPNGAATQPERAHRACSHESEKAAMPAKRIANIIAHMTYAIYLYIQRGLFERHKLTFALMLTNKICVSAGTLSPELVNIFLKGGGSLDIKSVKKKPRDWIPDKCWLDLCALAAYPTFSDLLDSFSRNDSLWRQWYDHEAPETLALPDFEERTDKFEKMCLVKSLREDRTMVAAKDFISHAIGRKFVESVPLNMEKTWEEKDPGTMKRFEAIKAASPHLSELVASGVRFGRHYSHYHCSPSRRSSAARP